MDLDRLRDATRHARWSIRHEKSVDSTNRVLADEARAGGPSNAVLIADYQSAGKGRLDRSWNAPPRAGLLLSMSLPSSDSWPLGPVGCVSLSAVEACVDVAGVDANLKWPNDLLVESSDGHERKLAGVLAEGVVVDGVIARIIVGIGLNVRWPEPPETEAAAMTALEIEAGRPVSRTELAAALLNRVDQRLKTLTGDHSQVLSEYKQRCSTIGRQVNIELGDRVVSGTAVGVDDGGRLLVEGEQGITAFDAGDVVHLRTS